MLPLFLMILPALASAGNTRRTFSEIDTNDDRALTEAELGAWFIFHDIEFARRTASDLFSMFDRNRDQKVSWEEYVQHTFGSTFEAICHALYHGRPVPPESPSLDRVAEQTIRSSVRRWKAAGGDVVEFGEFLAFAHPDLYQHMRSVLVQETVETYDEDMDGRVSVHELLGKRFRLSPEESRRFSKGETVHSSRNLLGLHDTDGNGFLDSRELGFWLMENRQLSGRVQSDEVFEQLDSDGNTRVSFSEFERNLQHLKDSVVGSLYIREEL